MQGVDLLGQVGYWMSPQAHEVERGSGDWVGADVVPTQSPDLFQKVIEEIKWASSLRPSLLVLEGSLGCLLAWKQHLRLGVTAGSLTAGWPRAPVFSLGHSLRGLGSWGACGDCPCPVLSSPAGVPG